MFVKPLRRLRATVSLVAVVSALVLPTAPAYAQDDQGPSIIRDTEIEAILRHDCDPIFAAAGLTPANVQIHIVGDKELNAFSAAGQQVFLNTGLIIEAKSPNQLIGVIAHETGHIAGGHIARSGEMGRAGIAPLILGMGLGVLAAIAGAPDAAAGLIYS